MSRRPRVAVAVDPALRGMSRVADRLEAAVFLPSTRSLGLALAQAKADARRDGEERLPVLAVLPSSHPSLIAVAIRDPHVDRVAVYHTEPPRLSRWKGAVLRAGFAFVDLTIVPDDASEKSVVRIGADPDRIVRIDQPILDRLLSEPRRRDRPGALLEAAASLALDAAEMGGLVAFAERLTPEKGVNVVNYHRVLPIDEHRTYARPQMALAEPVFEAQLDAFAAHRGFTRIENVHDANETGRVAITFDDGYEDNYRVAMPILRRYGAPACIFVVTGMLGHDTLWWDRVGRALFAWWEHGRASPLAPELASITPGLGEARSVEEARAIVSGALGTLNRAGEESRRRAVDAAEALAPPAIAVPRTMLTWAEVEEMHRAGISFGSHTRHHVELDTVAPTRARDEIVGSQADLEAHLSASGNGARRLCALPRGVLGPLHEGELREAGFSAVMTTEAGVNRPGEPSILVRRRDGKMLTLRGRHHPAKLRLELTGLVDRFRKWRYAED